MFWMHKIIKMYNKIRQIVTNSPLHNLGKSLSALLKSAFTKMELMTREDLLIPEELLLKTRNKLELSDVKLAQLLAKQVS